MFHFYLAIIFKLFVMTRCCPCLLSPAGQSGELSLLGLDQGDGVVKGLLTWSIIIINIIVIIIITAYQGQLPAV